MPFYHDTISFLLDDNTMLQASVDKLKEKRPIKLAEYQRLLTYPPEGTLLGDTHKNIFIFSDMAMVNQSIFLLKDSIVMIYDLATQTLANIFIGKVKIVGLYKLKQASEDDHGYKHTNYKVVAVHKNGTLSVFIPTN